MVIVSRIYITVSKRLIPCISRATLGIDTPALPAASILIR